MLNRTNIILTAFTLVFVFSLLSCDDAAPEKKQTISNVTSKKISQPVVPKKVAKKNKAEVKQAVAEKETPNLKKEGTPGVDSPAEPLIKPTAEHYDSKGKIDPFKPLIQERTEGPSVVVDKRPKRILTPLERIELSQIKLVAVIILKDRQIAMVEEANGKGYEVGIGTYIGKNQGRVSEIKSNSILIKEVYKDFKGQLKERTEEIKLHKNDSEG